MHKHKDSRRGMSQKLERDPAYTAWHKTSADSRVEASVY